MLLYDFLSNIFPTINLGNIIDSLIQLGPSLLLLHFPLIFLFLFICSINNRLLLSYRWLYHFRLPILSMFLNVDLFSRILLLRWIHRWVLYNLSNYGWLWIIWLLYVNIFSDLILIFNTSLQQHRILVTLTFSLLLHKRRLLHQWLDQALQTRLLRARLVVSILHHIISHEHRTGVARQIRHQWFPRPRRRHLHHLLLLVLQLQLHCVVLQYGNVHRHIPHVVDQVTILSFWIGWHLAHVSGRESLIYEELTPWRRF